ncbi:MAG: urea carboxylase-associated family protein [Allobranchiibius sp.]
MTDPRRPATPSASTPPRPYAGSGDGPAPGWTRLPPQTGLLVHVPAGAVLQIVDPCGEQVADLYLTAVDDPQECLSAGRTVDYNNTLYVSAGDRLWSNRSTVMATIIEDTVGIHDLTLTPCSQATFDVLYPEFGGAPHPSCFANLCDALGPVGVAPDRIGTTMNVFMDVWTSPDGRLHIDPPPTRPGDLFAIRAEVDLYAGVTACSAEKSNNGTCTPIDIRVQTGLDRPQHDTLSSLPEDFIG